MTEAVPVQKFDATVAGLYLADGDDFVSRSVSRLDLELAGISGDIHAGISRKSGAREPWYPRGTIMRNERQLSILSVAELAEVAIAMGIDRLEAEWIGANIVLDGVTDLSRLPPRTQLFFASGAVVRIDGDNGPCRDAGGAIARNIAGREGLDRAFVSAAKGRRGLVGWVEREGKVAVDDEVTVRIWPQKLYRIK
jgi:MOSC domain